MIDLGTVKPGSTIRIPFSTFDKDDGSSITQTNYAAADILIYKDGSTTERASTAGFTATTDFDAKTGKQLAVIDLADNTTAGFYAAGSEYLVAIDAVTVDTVTTGGWIARFRIGYVGAILDTTIATLSTQTSFTLTAGPAEDDALNGCVVAIHDVASAVQMGFAVVNDYTGSTKTVTLAAGTTFTAAATDNISFFHTANLSYILGAAISTSSAQLGVNAVQAGGTAWGSGAITAGAIAADAITSAKVAAGAFTYDDQITTFKSELSGLVATIPDGHITAAKIAADAITSAKVAAGAFVYDDQITTFRSELSGLAITIPNDHITSAKIAAGAMVYDDQITTFRSELSGLAITIPNDHITSAKIAAGAMVYDDQITTFRSELSGLAITIPNGHITSAKIGADAIGSDKVAAGAFVYDDQITTFRSELSGLAITIPNDHITSAKIAAGALVYDDQITTFRSELSGLAITIPNDHITSAKIAAGALVYDDQITTFKSELSGLYTRLTTQGVRDIVHYATAHIAAFPGSSPVLLDAIYWNYSQAGFKRLQQPTSYVLYDYAGTTKIASATISGTSAEVIIGTFQ